MTKGITVFQRRSLGKSEQYERGLIVLDGYDNVETNKRFSLIDNKQQEIYHYGKYAFHIAFAIFFALGVIVGVLYQNL